nr:hypothetical protein [Entomoplasma sp. MP1]
MEKIFDMNFQTDKISFYVKCDNCGAIEHISNDRIQNIDFNVFKDLILNSNQQLEHVKIELHVICEECNKKKENNALNIKIENSFLFIIFKCLLGA